MMENIKTALSAVWANKIRSLLNIIGVVIGVSSVTILISLGEGLKKDVSSLIGDFGTNLIFVTGGKIDTSSSSTQSSNPANFISGDVLTLTDVETIEDTSGIKAVTPSSLVSGSLKYEDKSSATTVFGAYPNLLDALSILTIDKGKMFKTKNAGNVIVLGKTATDALFGEANPVGKKVTLGQRELEVIGTIGSKQESSVFGSEFDAMSVIPFDTATEINKNQVKIFRIFATATETEQVDNTKQSIKTALLENHAGEEDFSVLTQDDMLGLFNTFLNLATTMVSAIAAISLLVGGIGIMNIMLVTVTERTREIGLRKAVGATKSAIAVQFLVEAVVVTLLGALIGLAIAVASGLAIAAYTDLTPLITPSIIILAAAISIAIGVLFGLWPALRAANKDPIEALRYE